MCITEFVLPPHFTVPDHGHAPPHLLVMLHGALRETHNTGAVMCTAGSLRYSPGGDQHTVRALGSGAHCLVIEALGFPELRLTRRIYLQATGVTRAVATFRELLLNAPQASPAAVEEAALALFALVRDRSRDSRARRHRWVAEVRRRLDERSTTAAPLRDAARHVQRSDGLVARAFRASYGVSIDWYRRRLQIDCAWTLLGNSARTLSDVAACAGFADQSHMTRVFVREVGDTPARLRQRMRRVREARHWFRAVPVSVVTGA